MRSTTFCVSSRLSSLPLLEAKSLFCNILPLSPCGSRFCGSLALSITCKSFKNNILQRSIPKNTNPNPAAKSLFPNILRVSSLNAIFYREIATSIFAKLLRINILDSRREKRTQIPSWSYRVTERQPDRRFFPSLEMMHRNFRNDHRVETRTGKVRITPLLPIRLETT